MLKKFLSGLAILAVFAGVPAARSLACTRAVFLGADQLVITGRSMDWSGPMGTNLWIFPRGLSRNGAAGAGSVTWVSKYGSVVTSIFDGGSADGMNEKGLVVNMLYLAESQYETAANAGSSKPISISAWVQYILDNYATVDEAVAALSKAPIYAVPLMSPDGVAGQVHVSISDASGDSAILEYVNGKLDIHHGRQFQVMTNSPIFDQQLALNAYWEDVGTAMLPGTSRAADRFVRASYYINAVPKTGDANLGVAEVFSVMRNVSVPLGILTPGKANLSSTLWRTVADQRDKVYYFESTRYPSIVWVNFSSVNFAAGQPSKELRLATAAEASGAGGDVTGKFVAAPPFAFLAATPK
jgi:choloylglycine hydrolase